MRRPLQLAAAFAAVALACTASVDASVPTLEYPFDVEHWHFDSQRQEVFMAYMDVRPEGEPRGTVLLLHGKNFCAAYWGDTIAVLVAAGYRTIAPDQIGFCRSDKPERYQYSFAQLADNTHRLLESLGVERAHVVGHSMGGMLATRFALVHPQAVRRLVLVNPIGLEDWAARGVPYLDIDAAYRHELGTNYLGIKRYQLANYYAGEWKPEYERWARMLAQVYEYDRPTAAWAQALTSDMVFTQPVVHEFAQLPVPTTLIVGLRDRTAIGRDRAPATVRDALGNYPVLAREVERRIPDATLVALDDVGHLPHVEVPERFHEVLLEQLAR